MVHVRLVVRAIAYAALLRVLAPQDERRQRAAVDPVRAFQNGQTRQHPPAVTHVRQLLRPAVQTTRLDLPLAQPPPEQIAVNLVRRVRQPQSPDAREDLPGVALAAGLAPEAAVEVFAPRDVPRGGGDVHRLRAPDQPARAQRAVREPRVDFAPHVTAERPVVVLKRGAVRRDGVGVDEVHAIAQRADLHRAERVQDVRVVPLRPAVPAARVSARLEPRDDGLQVHLVEPAHQIQRSEAPVHAAHAQVLGQDVLQRVAIFRRADDEGRVLRRVQELGGEGGRVLRRVVSARVLRRVPVG